MESSQERAIGRLEGRLDGLDKKLDALIVTIQHQDEMASESRRRLYDRVDRVEDAVNISGQVAAQARDQSAATDKLVREEIKPVTDDVKRMRRAGLGILGFLGTAFGITVGEPIKQVLVAIRSWLTG